MSIQVSHLAKSFGPQKAVDDISFTAAKSEILGFLGPNGAGKTTTMRMITGYLAPDAGTVAINGVLVEEENAEARKRIGYLSEQNPLYVDMYVREYLMYVASIYHLPDRKSRIDDVIGMTGLQTESHKLIGSLSKGYKQRIGLAQAIIHDPDVLILDEATSGLDPNQLVEIRQLIRDLGKEKTILLSTHIMQEVQALCDRVIIINKGKIVADGKIPMLSQLVTAQHRTKVTFSRTVFNNTLKEIKGYVSHEHVDGTTYIIFGSDKSINESIFDFAISKNLKILELISMEENVESIFQQFTASKS